MLQATDADAGVNARLTYTISAGVADRLAMNRSTGAVTLRNKIRLGERLEFTVTAVDGGQTPRYPLTTPRPPRPNRPQLYNSYTQCIHLIKRACRLGLSTCGRFCDYLIKSFWHYGTFTTEWSIKLGLRFLVLLLFRALNAQQPWPSANLLTYRSQINGKWSWHDDFVMPCVWYGTAF